MNSIVGRSSTGDLRVGSEITPERGHFITFYNASSRKQLDLYHGFSVKVTKETSYLQVFETNGVTPVRTVFFL
jgi:hypothetical protein